MDAEDTCVTNAMQASPDQSVNLSLSSHLRCITSRRQGPGPAASLHSPGGKAWGVSGQRHCWRSRFHCGAKPPERPRSARFGGGGGGREGRFWRIVGCREGRCSRVGRGGGGAPACIRIRGGTAGGAGIARLLPRWRRGAPQGPPSAVPLAPGGPAGPTTDAVGLRGPRRLRQRRRTGLPPLKPTMVVALRTLRARASGTAARRRTRGPAKRRRGGGRASEAQGWRGTFGAPSPSPSGGRAFVGVGAWAGVVRDGGARAAGEGAARLGVFFWWQDSVHRRRLAHKRRRLACNRRRLALKRRRLACNRRRLALKRRRLACNRRRLALKRRRLACNCRRLACNRRGGRPTTDRSPSLAGGRTRGRQL